ncbi:hypothetical protein Bbelb_224040 [Branchiostoma belcheri]|nr:hypothetical protein Bbelb_224040 [Branchiostoma belcheri]
MATETILTPGVEGLFQRKRSSAAILSDPRVLAHLQQLHDSAQANGHLLGHDDAPDRDTLPETVANYNRRNPMEAFKVVLKNRFEFKQRLLGGVGVVSFHPAVGSFVTSTGKDRLMRISLSLRVGKHHAVVVVEDRRFVSSGVYIRLPVHLVTQAFPGYLCGTCTWEDGVAVSRTVFLSRTVLGQSCALSRTVCVIQNRVSSRSVC